MIATQPAPQKLDKSGERVRQMFAEIAPRYDWMNHLLSMNIDHWWRRVAVNKLRLDRTEPVYDVCTGTGDLALALARKLQGKASVIATDFCEEMLEFARRKQAKLGINEKFLRFQQADTQELPWDSRSSQAITVAFGIRNVCDTDRGIQEMLRVLVPGGQFLILEFSKPTFPILRQLYSGYFRFVLPHIGQSLAKNQSGAYEYLPESVHEFPSGKEMVHRLRSHGLRDVHWYPMTLGIASIYMGVK